MPSPAADRIAVALDVASVGVARRLIAQIADHVGVFKIGHQLAFAGGLDLAAELVRSGHRVFLDMKLLDIGNTVAHGVNSVAALGATYLTVHAYPQAMRAAVKASDRGDLKLLGVTVLTSMDDDDLAETGYAGAAGDLVVRRAEQAREIGMDGLICSPQELTRLRPLVGADMLLVTPGIRPAGADIGDQKRIATPASAVRDGADLLVIGRPITQAADPAEAARRIADEIAEALDSDT